MTQKHNEQLFTSCTYFSFIYAFVSFLRRVGLFRFQVSSSIAFIIDRYAHIFFLPHLIVDRDGAFTFSS